MVPPSSDRAVSNFVAQYKRERDTYRKLERLATDFCRDLVARQAIKATIASRTKQVHRLEVKAKERVWKYAKKYFTKDDVRDDIWDLVGVRINVFFPSDAGKATEIIKDSFTLVKQSSYPRSAVASPPPTQGSDDNSRPTFKRRFNGYVSDHYRVRMKEENMTEELKGKFKGFEPMMEIQVASMLMHAWAEIDHDLVYKKRSGSPSDEELRLLDAINGIAQSGEILLDQLQISMETRLYRQKEPFSE